MGIYDREYYRGETRGSGWFSGLAPACKTIILINVVVFVLQMMEHAGPIRPTGWRRRARGFSSTGASGNS